MREADIVRRLARLRQSRNPAVIEGIGDDCAVVRPSPGSDLVFTTDFLIEDRHFALRTHTPESIGHKALARSLSDLAAMGSDPVFCLVSLALPAHLTEDWIDRFYKGLLRLAREYKITLAGGDLSKFDHVIVDVMCCGRVPTGSALLRRGARPGDGLYVTGTLGAAAASNWLREPEPRITAGRKLRGLASSCMDLSDGLSLDLTRLCLESGVSAELSSHSIPVAAGAVIEQALHGGEDYELLFTASPGVRVPSHIAKLRVTRIGDIGRKKTPAVLLDGRPLPAAGFDHFSGKADS
jgi:thiamine-monophosphate kinase